MTHTSATAEPSSASIPLEAVREPLPAIFVGESVVAGPTAHEWPGKLFVGLSWLIAGGLGILACVTMSRGVLSLEPQTFGLGVAVGVWCLVQRRLTSGVRQFTRWGWYGAMMEVGAVTAAKLGALAMGTASGVGLGLILDIVWLHYFWRRRADFGVDLGG
jgi:hypothetical protein